MLEKCGITKKWNHACLFYILLHYELGLGSQYYSKVDLLFFTAQSSDRTWKWFKLLQCHFVNIYLKKNLKHDLHYESRIFLYVIVIHLYN